MDRPSDVFDGELTKIVERVVQLVPDLLVDHLGNADPVRLGQRFQPGCDVDAVTVNILGFGDDVPNIDADTKADPLIIGDTDVTTAHPALYLDGTKHGLYDTGEFCQHAVTGVFDDPAVMLPYFGIHQFAAVRLEALVRSFLVRSHQTRVADRIGGEDRGKTTGRSHSTENHWDRFVSNEL